MRPRKWSPQQCKPITQQEVTSCLSPPVWKVIIAFRWGKSTNAANQPPTIAGHHARTMRRARPDVRGAARPQDSDGTLTRSAPAGRVLLSAYPLQQRPWSLAAYRTHVRGAGVVVELPEQTFIRPDGHPVFFCLDDDALVETQHGRTWLQCRWPLRLSCATK